MIRSKIIDHSEDLSNGIVQYIKKQTEDDLVDADLVGIEVPSFQDHSNKPKVLLGIDNEDYSKYYSTNYNEPDKYVLFDFKNYSLTLEGISINTWDKDWRLSYIIEGSLDNRKIDCSTSIDVPSPYIKEWKYFPFDIKMKPSRFIKISSTSKAAVSDNTHYAFYGIEFFGKIQMTQDLIECKCTCLKQIHFFSFHLFISLHFLVLLVKKSKD